MNDNYLIVTILDDYSIGDYKPKTNNAILIRILEPSYRFHKIPYNLKYEKNFKSVLNLYFQDISEDIPDCPRGIKLFTYKHIKKIIRFLNKNKGFKEIVIHCNKGQSRSPALMLGICELIKDDYYNIDEIKQEIFEYRYYHPNKLILSRFNDYFGYKNI